MVKSASLVRTGLTDEIIEQLGDYRSSDLPAAWKSALAFTDHLAGNPKGPISETLYGELEEHFSQAEILRLGALLAVGSGWQRMIEAFGIRPDHFEPGQDGPWMFD
jgi:alkylhydroperoxidase family enzyme